MIGDVTAFARRYAFAGVAVIYLFLLGFLRARNRPLISIICRHFGYRSGERLPEKDLEELVQGCTLADIRCMEPVNGNISIVELVALARIVRARRPKAIFEIGTFNGRTTLNLAANAPTDAEIWTLDLPREMMGRTKFRLAPAESMFVGAGDAGVFFCGTEFEDRIHRLVGDSATFDFSPYEGQMDLIFVDGSHALPYVLNDSRVALRLAKADSGAIVWHDYGVGGWDGVTRALNRLYDEDGVFGSMFRIKGTSLVCLFLDSEKRR